MSERPQENVGQLLKSEREARGISLDVIQEATKIPLDSLRAIEEGYKIRTLTAFYYRSFVKIYAQYLGLDPFPILALIPSYQQPKRAPLSAERLAAMPKDTRSLNIIAIPSGRVRSGSVGKLVGIVFMLALVGAGLFFGVRSIVHLWTSRPMRLEKKEAVVTPADVVQAPKKTEKMIVPVDKKKTVAKATTPHIIRPPVTVVKETAPEKDPKEKTETNPSAIEKTPVAVTKTVSNKVSLTVRAPVTAWFKVSVDGVTVFQGTLKKGNSESWTGTKKIEIFGRDIELLEYEINGESIGKISRRDIKVKKVLVTPDGLSVEK